MDLCLTGLIVRRGLLDAPAFKGKEMDRYNRALAADVSVCKIFDGERFANSDGRGGPHPLDRKTQELS